MLTKWLPFVYMEGCPKNGVEQLEQGPRQASSEPWLLSLNVLCGYRVCVCNPIFPGTVTHYETPWLGLQNMVHLSFPAACIL